MTAFQPTAELTSWGRVLRAPHDVARPRWPDELAALVAQRPAQGLLAVGLGRSYGDSALNPGGAVIDMRGLDRVHGFDPETGVVRADAGLSLDALIRVALPHGWFPPVVPGTRFVTLGGAIANDVHGKNHHREGTFGRHVRRLALLQTDGSLRELGPEDDTGLFAATVGGLGLTGVILWAELQLARSDAWLEAEDIAFGNLDEFFRLAAESDGPFAYNVAWVDCAASGGSLGRGIYSRANPAPDDDDRTTHGDPRITMPVDLPSMALNPLTLKTFNAAYYALKSTVRGARRVHYDSFFFPLDAIGRWNRLYGPRGFYQYQCVVPKAAARAAVGEMLAEIAKSGQGSFLAVLKTFGEVASPGLLSFPMEGTTLALDFQNGGEATLKVLARLDAIVAAAAGRLYPAKDGRISREMFAAGFPRLAEFTTHVDPGMSSAFWRRVAP